MLAIFGVIITGIWTILSIPFPLASNVTFNLWQYFTFLFLVVMIIKKLFNKSKEGGKE